MSRKKPQPIVIPFPASYDAKKEAENNTFGRRLSDARRRKGWSLKSLAFLLEDYNIFVQAAAISKWELGMTTPSPYQLFALCRLLEIEDGIRFFSGALRPGEAALNEQGLKKLEEYRKDLIATGLYNFVDPDEDIEDEIERPVYDLPVSAGTGNFLDGDNYRMERFKASTVPMKANFALTVSGDSMMPNYTDGQMVWVQETPELRHGEIGIFVLNGSAYMKMYTEAEPDESLCPKITLVSLNRKYDPIPVGEFDEFRIVGRVLTR